MQEMKVLLRAADVAPLLGLTTGRVYQLIADGVLPSVRIGGAILIPREAWDEWLAKQKERALSSVRPEGAV